MANDNRKFALHWTYALVGEAPPTARATQAHLTTANRAPAAPHEGCALNARRAQAAQA